MPLASEPHPMTRPLVERSSKLGLLVRAGALLRDELQDVLDEDFVDAVRRVACGELGDVVPDHAGGIGERIDVLIAGAGVRSATEEQSEHRGGDLTRWRSACACNCRAAP